MTFIILRKIDTLGRIVLPIDMRRFFRLSPGCAVTFAEADGDILVTRAEGSAVTSDSRTVDALGRMVIPVAVRRHLGIRPRHVFAVLPTEDGIRLRPTESV